jgi:hypothetical protein
MRHATFRVLVYPCVRLVIMFTDVLWCLISMLVISIQAQCSNGHGHNPDRFHYFGYTKYEGRFQISWTHHSESELCGGALTVSFSEYLPWQAMHFLQRSTHFLKTCCRPLITLKFASDRPLHGCKSPEIAWGEILTV